MHQLGLSSAPLVLRVRLGGRRFAHAVALVASRLPAPPAHPKVWNRAKKPSSGRKATPHGW